VHGLATSLALETLEEMSVFGGTGTVAAVAVISVALQSLPPGIPTDTHSCCPCARICNSLSWDYELRISKLLSISAVLCGVDRVNTAGSDGQHHVSSCTHVVAAFGCGKFGGTSERS
jgi:hypothetical protein